MKLEQSRGAALSLSSNREEENKREHARLADEVNRLQRDYSRVRSELDIERERSRTQLAAQAAASSEFAPCVKSEEDTANLKEEAAEAEKERLLRRLNSEMVQESLFKTEEKLRLASRVSGAGDANVVSPGSSGHAMWRRANKNCSRLPSRLAKRRTKPRLPPKPRRNTPVSLRCSQSKVTWL